MDLSELKELYAEELALLKRIQRFMTERPRGELERVEKVVMFLLFRICSNLHSTLILTAAAYKKGKMAFFQLPIGIILRCTFTDCIFALYLERIEKDRAYEELELRTIEYANSLLERREVYRDQVNSIGKVFDDDFIDNLWELTMEDNFLNWLSITKGKNDLEVTKQTKDQLKDAGFLKPKSAGIKDQKDYLIKQDGLNVIATRLYHYYKYFSQYEHFSENGQGDVFASLEDDGNDNIHLPSAIRALSVGVEEVMKTRDFTKEKR